jgi:protein-L-isoaspartate(D-aspartate) O-methyltransferase
MNLATLGPHHLAVQVTDLAAAERFYNGVLGLLVVKRWPYEEGKAGERSLWLQLGDTFVALEHCGQAAPASDFRDPQARLHLFALRIAPRDRAAWEKKLQQAGVEIVHRSRWTLYVRDPDGNRIGLSHHPYDEAPADESMSQRLRGQGIKDERLLAAFERVPREAFVPLPLRDQAREDRPLDIGFGQTISQPYIVAVMTGALHLSPGQRVLEVGTGSGYQTALLAALGVQIFSVEIIPELAQRAAETLRAQGFSGIALRVSDGAKGWPEQAPFDAILVAAAPKVVPPALLEQLAPGGRLIIPAGEDPMNQELQLWTKDAATGALERRVLAQVRFVPLTGAGAE